MSFLSLLSSATYLIDFGGRGCRNFYLKLDIVFRFQLVRPSCSSLLWEVVLMPCHMCSRGRVSVQFQDNVLLTPPVAGTSLTEEPSFCCSRSTTELCWGHPSRGIWTNAGPMQTYDMWGSFTGKLAHGLFMGLAKLFLELSWSPKLLLPKSSTLDPSFSGVRPASWSGSPPCLFLLPYLHPPISLLYV